MAGGMQRAHSGWHLGRSAQVGNNELAELCLSQQLTLVFLVSPVLVNLTENSLQGLPDPLGLTDNMSHVPCRCLTASPP